MRYRRLALEDEPEYNYGDGKLNAIPGGYSHVAVNGSTGIRGSGGNYVNKPGEGTANWCGFKYYGRDDFKTMADVGIGAFWEAEFFMKSGLIEHYEERNTGDMERLKFHYNNRTFSPIRNKVTILNQFTSPLPKGGNRPFMRGGKIIAGDNICAFNYPIHGEKTIYFKIQWSGTASAKIDNIKFLQGGEYLSLKELVETNIIKPLVLIGTEDPGVSGTQCADALRLYDGSPTERFESYAAVIALFMTNDTADISGVRFTANNREFDSTSDCWLCGMTDIRNFRVTLENFSGLEIMTPQRIFTTIFMNYDIEIAVGGNEGECSFEITRGAIPEGMTFTAAGKFSGMPFEAGTFNFTVKATDINGKTATKQFAFTVQKYTLKWVTTNYVHVYDGKPHTATVTPSNVPDVPGMPEEAKTLVQDVNYKLKYGNNASGWQDSLTKGVLGTTVNIKVELLGNLGKYYDVSKWSGYARLDATADYTFNVSDMTCTYDGNPHAIVPEIYSNFNNDSISHTVTYYGTGETKYRRSETPPTATGTYKVDIYVDDNYYKRQTKTVNLTITE